MNAAGEQFGLQRLQNAIAGEAPVQELVERLEAGLRAHVQGVEQSDDITVLAIKAQA
jgi:serine phosphatase RsbU (regulator of sigma subunit)